MDLTNTILFSADYNDIFCPLILRGSEPLYLVYESDFNQNVFYESPIRQALNIKVFHAEQ